MERQEIMAKAAAFVCSGPSCYGRRSGKRRKKLFSRSDLGCHTHVTACVCVSNGRIRQGTVGAELCV